MTNASPTPFFGLVMLPPLGSEELGPGQEDGIRYNVVADLAPILARFPEPTPADRQFAREAHYVAVEDFDGARVSESMLRLVWDCHGGINGLRWVRGNEMHSDANGNGAPAVFVYAGDQLVALVAPLQGSTIRPRGAP